MSEMQVILAAHPTPWKYIIGHGGVIKVRDAAGVEVELLTVLSFVSLVTAAMGAPKAEKQPG